MRCLLIQQTLLFNKCKIFIKAKLRQYLNYNFYIILVPVINIVFDDRPRPSLPLPLPKLPLRTRTTIPPDLPDKAR